ncbi:MAG TPA: YIP1 family protein [Mobilitalea sp.]|nr:YIP1 family protein [Mobilitalea sp.]
MKRFPKLLITLALICVITGLSIGTTVAYAEVPYKTYTHDGYGWAIETQAAYIPYDEISKIGNTTISGARDMMITDDGIMYIADTGNKRVLVTDLNGNYIKEFGSDILVNPTGIYVTKDKHVYVADSDAGMVFEFDENGTVINQYGKPNHPLYGDGMDYKPLKVVVNDAGNMFVICEANTNGIVQISPTDGGTFLGYFGANMASHSITDILLRMFLTDKQRAKMVSNTPPTPDNLAIDDKGLIYTVTRGQKLDTLKRLNIAGKNVIEPDDWDDYPVAVTAGNYDNCYMVSSQGYIYEFNNEGNMLFVFGGKDDGRQRIGLAKKIEAIAVDSKDRIYILDSEMNQIHIFAPTEFTNLLHNALNLYSKGQYTESKDPLDQILKMNSMFGYSNKAMGRAYLQEENYSQAMKYSKLASDYTTYSDSFWEVRNIWLQKNLVPAIGIFILLYIIVRILKRLHRKYGIFNNVIKIKKKIGANPLVSRLSYSFYFLKHPIDGCYGVRWEGKSSFLSANILLTVFISFNVISKYFSGFLFKGVREGRYNLLSDIGTIVITFLLLTVCCYLISTINDGEGTFKQLYCGFTYSLTPFLIIQPLIFIISHLVTYNEKFLVQFPNTFMVIWIVIYLIITIKEINNLTVKETAKVIALTFFAALIALLLVFIIYVLWAQVYDFIVAISGEVVYRLGF